MSDKNDPLGINRATAAFFLAALFTLALIVLAVYLHKA